jgi:hypothetical protein
MYKISTVQLRTKVVYTYLFETNVFFTVIIPLSSWKKMRPFSFPTRTTAKCALKRTVVIATGSDHAHVFLVLSHKQFLPTTLLIHKNTETALHYLNKKLKEKKDSIEVGTNYEHHKAKHYLTQELKELNNNNFHPNSSVRSCTNRIHWLSLRKATKKRKQVRKPSPSLRSQGTWTRSNIEKAHGFAEH